MRSKLLAMALGIAASASLFKPTKKPPSRKTGNRERDAWNAAVDAKKEAKRAAKSL